jgi:hypothetical protein
LPIHADLHPSQHLESENYPKGNPRFNLIGFGSSNPLIEFENKPTKLLPLSSRHCLFMSFDPQFIGSSPSTTTCDREIVTGINELTIKNSWQYVYSGTPDFDV